MYLCSKVMSQYPLGTHIQTSSLMRIFVSLPWILYLLFMEQMLVKGV